MTCEELENSKATVARLTGEVEDLQAQVKVLSIRTQETMNASAEQLVAIPTLERQSFKVNSEIPKLRSKRDALSETRLVQEEHGGISNALCLD